MLTATQLVAYAQHAADSKWGYVLGAQGEKYSKELAQKWANAKQGGKPASYFLSDCARWFGHYVADCSGLIVAAIQSTVPAYTDRNADTLYSQCTAKGAIGTIPDVPGLCVWRKGHIGVYIGGGKAIEARGYTYGVVKTKVADRDWTNWGYLRDIDYKGGSTLLGWRKTDGKWYYDQNGKALTGWQELSWKDKTDWYYFDASGAMRASKWVKSSGKDYYLDKSGAMATNAWILSADGTKVYWVDSKGVWDSSKTIQVVK